MAGYWFTNLGDVLPSRERSTRFAVVRGALYAVAAVEQPPFDPVDAVREFPMMRGASLEGMVLELDDESVDLPETLHPWSRRNFGADELGPGSPTAMIVDGSMFLAERWEFSPLSLWVTLVPGECITVLAPERLQIVDLVSLKIPRRRVHGEPDPVDS